MVMELLQNDFTSAREMAMEIKLDFSSGEPVALINSDEKGSEQ